MLIALSSEVDPKAAELLGGFDDVTLATDAPQSVVVLERDVLPVRVEMVDADGVLSRIEEGVRPASLLVVNAVLDDRVAARLEDAGVGYFDAGGRRWLPGLRRTERARHPRTARKRGLSGPSIRLGQLLADYSSESWTERSLARRGLTTQATAHRFLSRLESEGLIEREGKGRVTSRWVKEPERMRAWLAREARPRGAALLPCFVADPFQLPQLPGRSFVLTGAVAAAELGLPVLVGGADPMMRVNVDPDELEEVPQALGGFRVDAGANLMLVADPDRLAFDADVLPSGIAIASPSRVMLDLYLEGRGDAAVGVFLDLWGSREIAR